ncbi:hypothetical protein Y032_0067g107 [Ancylostoma ceylanicum]|uniref:Uncharacterized protein n=1 Tax=Ancylostoma ceylanicum TaxID=53326 RepID=A0A016TZ85_9BILA|nr:hypothetical protein Y032_0067g107 [Ancylostoma ceylanicum]
MSPALLRLMMAHTPDHKYVGHFAPHMNDSNPYDTQEPPQRDSTLSISVTTSTELSALSAFVRLNTFTQYALQQVLTC